MSHKPNTFGLIGFPLEHSYSAVIHHAAFAELRLPGSYHLFPVRPFPDGEPRLKELLLDLREGRLRGLNVTIPWKKAIQPYLDGVTSVADQVGATNTLFIEDGKLVGENTDSPAFISDLINCFPNIPRDGSALILGAGGSAYSVAYAMLQAGWSIHVAARRIEQAEILKTHFQRQINQKIPVETYQLNTGMLTQLIRHQKFSLIVNCTPKGMFPNIHESPWPTEVPFPKGAVVYDLIYNPQETALVRQARQNGLSSVTGGGMLVEQAARAFERWYGIQAPRKVMRKAFHLASLEAS